MVDIIRYLNVYEFDEILPGTGQMIKLRPYAAADIKRLLLASDQEEALDTLIQNCVITSGFNVNDITLPDRLYLLVSLRKKTKGTTYTYTYVCPVCQSQRIVTVDLKRIKTKPLSSNFSRIVKLDDNISLELKPVTRGAIKEALKRIDEMEKEKQTDLGEAKTLEQLMLIYALSIVKFITPEGEHSPTLEEALDFINNEKLPRWMFEKITEWFESLDYGIDLKIVTECDNKKCNEYKKEVKEDIQLGDFLF